MKKNKFNKEEQNLFAVGGLMTPYGVAGFTPYDVPMGTPSASQITMYYDGLNAKKEIASRKNNKQSNINAGVSSKLFGDGGTLFDYDIAPTDNTRVNASVVLPVERQSNFTDSNYFLDSGSEFPAGFWRQKDGSFRTTNIANGEPITFTQEEVDSIVRANTAKGRKERLKKAMESKFAYGGLMNDSPTLLNAMPKNVKAIGGVVQTNSSDFSTGLTHINNGGSHEESPYDGVQIGIDSEGVPNLVEEGEVIFNDYVFSKRINLDEDAKKKFHFPKKSELSYADAAKKLEKEVKERPNDPISRASFKAQMKQLEEQQERQKQEIEAERAKEAFEALSPEEQTALMQQKAQQDAMEEQAAQEQAMAEVQAAQGQPSSEEMAAMEQQAAMQQQMSPEEAAMMQQQMEAQQGDMPTDGIPQAAPVQQPQFAEGGNLYPWGGVMDLFKVNPPYAASRMVGNIPYIQDENHKYYDQNAVITEEGTPRFKAWTDYVNKYWNDPSLDDVSKKQIYDYLKLLDATAGGNHLFDKNGDMTKRAQQYFNKARTEDHKWGYYHLTPTQVEEVANELQEVNKEVPTPKGRKESKSTIWNADAGLKPEDSEVRKSIGSDTRGSTSAEGDKSIQAEAAGEGDKKKNEENFKLKPKYLSNPDYGLLGSAVPLFMQIAGIGKPDTSGMDAILANAARNYHTATNKYLGNYLTYKPMDTWFEQAKLDALTGATRRNVMNSGANQSTVIAGLLPLDLNAQIASGELFRKGLEYNNQDEMAKATFNRGTDQFNADAFNQLSKFNANVMNQAGQHYAQLGLQSELAKDDANRWWYSNLYQNINAIKNRLDQRYKERNAHNTMADIWAGGLVPVSDKAPMASRYVEAVYGAEGGRVKRKKNKRKGFTV